MEFLIILVIIERNDEVEKPEGSVYFMKNFHGADDGGVYVALVRASYRNVSVL